MRRLLNFFGLERSGKMAEPYASKRLGQPVWRGGGVKDGDQFESPQAQGWGPMDAASEGSVLLDETGQITEYNARALELLRCALPPESGADFWDAVPEEIAEQHQIATAKALSSSARHAFVVHHKFEGSWVEYSFMRQGAGYVVKLRDVASTQKLLRMLDDSERYNQLIFEVNPNAMWIFDVRSLRILAVNQAAIEFYGAPREKFLSLSMVALFPEGEGTALLGSLQPGTSDKQAQPELRVCRQQKMDGQLVLVELACGHVHWNAHQAILVSLADVTERYFGDIALRRANAALEQELARSQGELQNAHCDLAAFKHAVASDMQGPLHVVNGFATTLAERYAAVLDEQGRHYVSRIQASTRQLAKLVDDLRTLAQLPHLSRNLELLDLVPLCRALADDLRKREPGRVVTIDIQASLPLLGDKNLLKKALACLLENAWKFTSKKAEPWIKVALSPGKTPGELVLLVSDNGAGFDAAYGDRLFTAFQRLHSAADFPGNGLGLAIVKRVAAAHGGAVWAESTDQAGASFYMALPQNTASAPE